MTSPLVVRLGPNSTEIVIAARTPRAVVAAARKAVSRLDVEDLRAVSAWSEWCHEANWLGSDGGNPSIVGIVTVWIACAIVDVELPDGIDDDADQEFVTRCWMLAPRVSR